MINFVIFGVVLFLALATNAFSAYMFYWKGHEDGYRRCRAARCACCKGVK
jgi:hypothetical protein